MTFNEFLVLAAFGMVGAWLGRFIFRWTRQRKKLGEDDEGKENEE